MTESIKFSSYFSSVFDTRKKEKRKTKVNLAKYFFKICELPPQELEKLLRTRNKTEKPEDHDEYFKSIIYNKRNISKDVKEALSKFNKKKLVEFYSDYLDKNKINTLMKDYSIPANREPNFDALIIALVEQFRMIVNSTNDTVKNIIPETYDKWYSYNTDVYLLMDEINNLFDSYLKNAKRNHEINKYIPRQGSFGTNAPQEINYTTLEEALKEKQYILIAGQNGIGKTTILKHIFISYTDNFPPVPFFIELKNYTGMTCNEEQNSIIELVCYCAKKYWGLADSDTKLLLKKGTSILFMDDLDEIQKKHTDRFKEDLTIFLSLYSGNKVIITSGYKNASLFDNDDRGIIVKPLPLNIGDRIEFINNMDASEELKLSFLTKLETDHKHESTYHESMAGVPLLLKNMFESYIEYGDIPYQKHKLFLKILNSKKYENRLLTKISLKTGFDNILEALSANTYEKEINQFDKDQFLSFIPKNKRIILKDIDIEDYLTDLVTIGFLKKNGIDYQICHKSYQEYYVAKYLQKNEITKSFKKCIDRMFSDDTIDCLYGIDRSFCEKNIIYPWLSSLFENKDSGYKLFLAGFVKSIDIIFIFDKDFKELLVVIPIIPWKECSKYKKLLFLVDELHRPNCLSVDFDRMYSEFQKKNSIFYKMFKNDYMSFLGMYENASFVEYYLSLLDTKYDGYYCIINGLKEYINSIYTLINIQNNKNFDIFNEHIKSIQHGDCEYSYIKTAGSNLYTKIKVIPTDNCYKWMFETAKLVEKKFLAVDRCELNKQEKVSEFLEKLIEDENFPLKMEYRELEKYYNKLKSKFTND